jgi:phosphoribosyl-ATP pyrophosphohydrolase/phosphoribosyl-AMP cyclohydrolase
MNATLDFSKGLIPAVVQDHNTREVLMLGYMNEEAYLRTQSTGRVTFFSRSRKELWVKGETSGNYLMLVSMHIDCDSDSLLVLAQPEGPVCHTGMRSCFGDGTKSNKDSSFLEELANTIRKRRESPSPNSYTSRLFSEGVDRIVQKVGEEGIEVVIAGKNSNTDLLLEESADLIFHLMVLWEIRGVSPEDVVARLAKRHQS